MGIMSQVDETYWPTGYKEGKCCWIKSYWLPLWFLLSLFAWMCLSPYHMYITVYEFLELFGFKEGYNSFSFATETSE